MARPGSSAVALIAALATAAALAQSDASACASIENDRERLVCYDQAHARTPAAPANPGDAFGLTEKREPPAAREEAVEQITAKVAEVREPQRYTLVVTLDNGQVWRQTSDLGSLTLRAGDSVRIRRAALGSYLLYPPNGGSVRVKRVQ